MSLSFANPWALPLLLLIPLYLYLTRRTRRSALRFSRTGMLRLLSGHSAERMARLPGWLRGLVITSLIIALAAPRTGTAAVDVNAEGIAIVVVLDISSSMLAEDFAPRNRLHVAKEKVAAFVNGREYDRIGLVAFAGEALTQVPITIDYVVIHEALEQLEAGRRMLEDGTAIGTAIATGVNRLRRVPGESRVLLLITDGENNRGEIDPLTAARTAQAYGVRIHAIGVGTEGVAPMPVASGPFGIQYATMPVHIDDELLTELAQLTGGRYFRATNAEALDSITHEIDQLEKSSVDVKRYMNYSPQYLPFLVFAIVALVLEWGLRASRRGSVP